MTNLTLTLTLQVNLVALGSCGAFVHGLEDECLSVRSASVEALTKLSIGDQELAMIALDFLVDMFNDEIEQVRLKAIESLTAISRHILLQVHFVLTQIVKCVHIVADEGLTRAPRFN